MELPCEQLGRIYWGGRCGNRHLPGPDGQLYDVRPDGHMYEGMDIFYTAPPTKTHIPSSHALDNQNPLSVEAEAGDLARLVLADDVWQSYAPSETKVGFHAHPEFPICSDVDRHRSAVGKKHFGLSGVTLRGN